MDKKAKFLKIYANLPLSLRSEIVVVVEDQPFTWNSAMLEIESNSKVGNEILDKLFEMGIIKNEN